MEKIALLNLDPRDQRIIKKLTFAGLGAGAGAALITSLIGQLRSLKQETGNDTSADDDTMTVTLPAPQAKAAGIGAGTAIAAGGLASAGAYVVTRKIIQAIRQKELQKQLDEAQQVYAGDLAMAPKAASAGKPLGMSETLLSSPVALSLLLAAASGTLAYHGLDAKFGGKPKPSSPAPKRVQFRYQQPAQSPELAQEPQEKEASFSLTCGSELTGRLALAARPEHGDFADLVGAIASGRLGELRHNFHTIGTDASLELIKGASSALKDAPEPLVGLAIAAAVGDHQVGQTGRILAQAELLEAYPALTVKFANYAGTLDEEEANTLMGLAVAVGACARADSQAGIDEGVLMSKAAAATWLELLRLDLD